MPWLRRLTKWIGRVSLALFFGAGAMVVILGLAIDHNAAWHPAVVYAGMAGFCGMMLWLVLATAQRVADLVRSSRRMDDALTGQGSLTRLMLGQEERVKNGLLLSFFAGLALAFCALFGAFAEGRTGFIAAAAVLLVAGLGLLWGALALFSTFRKVRAAQRDLEVPDASNLPRPNASASQTATGPAPRGL